MSPRIAFVLPRYGTKVIGGAEAASRQAAIGLAQRGWDVEVLTSCAYNHYTWANDLPEGLSHEDGVAVRRWPNVSRWSSAGLRAQQKIQAEVLPTIDEQMSWLSWRFSVPGLFDHLLREGDEYDVVIFAPYLFWTTTVCLPLVRDRAVIMPCLHDEFYARLDVIKPLLADPKGVWFLSEPEHDLAHRLGPLAAHHTVTGVGVQVPTSYDPNGFRRQHGIKRPFILFAARREKEKGWDWLVEQFSEAVHRHGIDMDLVTCGAGDINPPEAIASRIVDLGSVSDAERDNAMAAAVAYVQPSKMESFSLTIMEAWLAGTPVLAVEGSEVVGWHCRRSGGGEIFSDAASLAAHLHRLVNEPEVRARMAELGRTYVLDNYVWPVVLDRMESDLRTLI
jgi:glycosyltransferase involved in cell wall biosynthesis